jgi:hypothetical protein
VKKVLNGFTTFFTAAWGLGQRFVKLFSDMEVGKDRKPYGRYEAVVVAISLGFRNAADNPQPIT